MSRRKTVILDMEFCLPKIKEVCRSNVVFCEKMGRPKQKTWVTEWGRGRNLPSPEEAARMCAILGVTPEEILVRPEDISLVHSLIDQERGKEKPATTEGSGLSLEAMELVRLFDLASPELQSAALAVLKSAEAADKALGAESKEQ